MKVKRSCDWAVVCALLFSGSIPALAETSSQGFSSQKQPVKQDENDSVVVEGLEKQPKLKDAPVPVRTQMIESRFLDSSVSPFALLYDVEKLTGIPPEGFDLSFDGADALGSDPKGTNR
jgi:hypothetical protein